jgi:hypothetical protein
VIIIKLNQAAEMKKLSGLLIIVLMLPLFSGCFGVSSYFSTVRNNLLKNIEGDFRTETEFAIGPTLITMAGLFISEEDDPETSEMLKDISRVQIGVYKRRAAAEGTSHYKILQQIDRRMKKGGWRYIVRNCSKDDISAIYVSRDPDKSLRRMFIVSLDKNELSLIQLDGNISGILEKAVHDRSASFSYSSR